MKKTRPEQRQRALIIDPYLDTLGGGEEHMMSMARVFEDKGFEITLAWDDPKIKINLSERFNLNLSKLEFKVGFSLLSVIERYRFTQQFDYLLYATDGSYFFSGAKNNYVFSMYPKKSLYKMSGLNILKLRNFQFIANSQFTEKHIKDWVGRPVHVITPYLQKDFFKPINKHKNKTIVSIGRFFEHLHSKRQDILIDAFEQFQKKESGWKLTLIGGLKDEDRDYFDKVIEKSKNNRNIEVIPNAPYKTMLSILDEATFYWHAAGYGINEQLHPDAVEHFGITPLEGLSRGCVVVAYDAGGQRDIIKNGVNGYLYTTIEELVDTTQKVAGDKLLYNKIQLKGVQTAEQFDYEHFKKYCEQIFNL